MRISPEYKLYLRSEKWKALREYKLKEADYKCSLCGNRFVLLEIHHNTYENIMKEKPSDLIVLCQECHHRYHRVKKAKIASYKQKHKDRKVFKQRLYR